MNMEVPRQNGKAKEYVQYTEGLDTAAANSFRPFITSGNKQSCLIHNVLAAEEGYGKVHEVTAAQELASNTHIEKIHLPLRPLLTQLPPTEPLLSRLMSSSKALSQSWHIPSTLSSSWRRSRRSAQARKRQRWSYRAFFAVLSSASSLTIWALSRESLRYTY